jgi:hypothetical protein
VTGLSERALGLASRVSSEERPRDLQHVSLVMLDGTEITGMLHRTPGTRTLDHLNHSADAFVAMTDATVTCVEHTEQVSFVAINKAQIVRVIEAAEPD